MVPKFSTFTGYLARLLPRVRNALPSTYCFQVLKRWIGAGPKISSLNGRKFLPCVHWRLVGASICSGQSKTGVDIGYEVMARNGETVVLIIACRGLILRFTSCNRAPFSSMVQIHTLQTLLRRATILDFDFDRIDSGEPTSLNTERLPVRTQYSVLATVHLTDRTKNVSQAPQLNIHSCVRNHQA